MKTFNATPTTHNAINSRAVANRFILAKPEGNCVDIKCKKVFIEELLTACNL